MDLKLKGRRALVTGSSSGIGEAIARMLSQEGCAVVVHGRNRERAEKVAADINAAGCAIGDLSTDGGAAALHVEARAALGGSIEILVNNAGGSSTGNSSRAPIEISPDQFISNYHANALSSVRLCRLAVPAMVAAKFGRVINISSAVAVQPNNLGADYSGAKAALNNFTVSLAGSLKGVGVTVNTVSPGIIMVDGMIRWGRQRYGDDNLTIEEITNRMAADKIFDLPPATDIPYTLGEGIPGGGVIRKGTVAGQHFEWTAWVDGAPFMIYHFYWAMGENVEPKWNTGDSCYRVVIKGDPSLEVRLMGGEESDGRRPFHGLPWTALLGATAVPAVCDASPGVVTHMDLGIVQPRGLVRRA